MTKNSGIYKITNINTGKIYIGSSKDLDNRWYQHIYSLKHQSHHNKYLQKSFNKHGQDAFFFEVLEKTDESNLLLLEQQYLDSYTPYKKDIGYNICSKSDRPDSDLLKQLAQDPEIKENQSRASKAMWANDEMRKHISAICKVNATKQWESGREKMLAALNTELVKQKRSTAAKENWKNKDYQEKRQEAHKEATANPEYRKKLSRASIDMHSDPIFKQKHKNSIKGKKKVFCIENQQIFDSISDAAKFVNVCPRYLKRCIRDATKCRNYTFNFETKDLSKGDR